VEDDARREARWAGGGAPRAGAIERGSGRGVTGRGARFSRADAVTACVQRDACGQQCRERDRSVSATPSPCSLPRLLDQRLEIGDALVERALVGLGLRWRGDNFHG
jgi:hypothetical protein